MTRSAVSGRMILVVWLFLAGSGRVFGAGDAGARFQGAGKADPIRIANVTCKPGDSQGAGIIAFDLAWDRSWRAVWDEPEARHGGQGALKVENWDAAWVFVKFWKPGTDGFSHATLSTNAADHLVPAGVKLDVGLTDDHVGGGAAGQRGVGVFVYRGAPGSGPNDWKGVKLRWLYGADGVPSVEKATVSVESEAKAVAKAAAAPGLDGAAAPEEGAIGKALEAAVKARAAAVASGSGGGVALRVYAIPVVYVPEGAFWVGDGATNGIAAQFAAGASTDPFRIAGEEGFTLGGMSAKNLGNCDGIGMDRAEDFAGGLTRSLPARFPKGYAAFYCMKRNITRREYASFFGTLGAGQRGDLYAGVQPGDAPDAECGEMRWGECAAYAAWAGLRPMTELEYEKACRGPLRPVPGEQAEYWGIMDLCGKMTGFTVVVGNQAGRLFVGTHGNGTVARPAGWPFPASGFGFAARGGRASDRSNANTGIVLQGNTYARLTQRSFRCVRTAQTGRAPLPEGEGVAGAQSLFNDRLSIGNVTVAPRDSKTATVRFDIAWDESWRNATNHDAAWVFFKTRAGGGSNGQHVRLVADKVRDPTGYGQENGTELDFLVPDGADGFTGVFVRRAAEGSGPLAAKGVTVVCDAQSLNTEDRTRNTPIQAFGIEMVYVPEGPFYLGSGGTEPNHFYKYTDGSQDNAPYRVTDSGAIPTGPQQGRLWAAGAAPDGSDDGEIPATFPNGFAAFYCMKSAVTHSQYVGFRCALDSPRRNEFFYDVPGWPEWVKRYNHTGNWSRCGLTWSDGAAFGAWAGLRPMTELEFEKACRGPREPAPNEARPSYWGIRDLTVGGAYTRAVTIANAIGRSFKGSQGQGAPAPPADWPRADGVGTRICGGGWSVGQIFVDPDHIMTSDRSGRAGAEYEGWRGVRTAPTEGDSKRRDSGGEKIPDNRSVLDLDPLPDLRQTDIGIVYLSGRFRNAGDQPLKVELSSPLPDACFPSGAAARTFTAAPGVATSFRIQTALALKTARAARLGQAIPIRIQTPNGDVLAEQDVRLLLVDPMAATPPLIGSIAGGQVTLRITNATDRACAFKIEMTPPPGVQMPETVRQVEVAPGVETRALFPVRSHLAVSDEFRRIFYSVAVADGAAQTGETVVGLRCQSRWWIDVTAATPETGGVSLTPVKPKDDLDGMLADILKEGGKDDEKKTVSFAPADLFAGDQRPGGWVTATHGAGLWLGHLEPRPAMGTIVLAATRVHAPGDRDAVVKVGRENGSFVWLDDTLLRDRRGDEERTANPVARSSPARFVGCIRFNDAVVYDSRPGAKTQGKPFRICKGSNTMLLECDTDAATFADPGDVFVLFHDAKTGSRLDGMTLDAEKR